MTETDAFGSRTASRNGGGTPAALLEEMRRRVEETLVGLLDRELAGTARGLQEPVRYAVLGPGKRVRPLLLLGAFHACGGDDPAGETLACTVEFVHAYSLVHDDLPSMDDDVLRRGRSTVHVRYGVPTAVYAGALLMPLAARTVRRSGRELGLGWPRVRRLLATLASASGASGMVGGQLLDLRAEGHDVSREQLERIHRGKTAALMSAAVEMGGLAARAEAATVERLGRFGLKLGLAFQAVDDILDVTGSDRQLGKTSGRDAALEKATYPSMLGLERAEEVSRSLAEDALDELAAIDGGELLEAVTTWVIERRR